MPNFLTTTLYGINVRLFFKMNKQKSKKIKKMARKQRTDTWTYKVLSIKDDKPKAFVRDTPDAALSLANLTNRLNKLKGTDFSCSIDSDNPCIVIVTANHLKKES